MTIRNIEGTIILYECYKRPSNSPARTGYGDWIDISTPEDLDIRIFILQWLPAKGKVMSRLVGAGINHRDEALPRWTSIRIYKSPHWDLVDLLEILREIIIKYPQLRAPEVVKSQLLCYSAPTKEDLEPLAELLRDRCTYLCQWTGPTEAKLAIGRGAYDNWELIEYLAPAIRQGDNIHRSSID